MLKQTAISVAVKIVMQANIERQLIFSLGMRSVLAGGLCSVLALSSGAHAAPNVAPTPSDNLAATAEQYRPIMTKDIDQSLAGARLLRERLVAGDVDGAEKAWIDARVGWER